MSGTTSSHIVMRQTLRFLFLLFLFASGSSCANATTEPPEFNARELASRGAYLARAADCAGCHRAGGDGLSAYSGGLPIRSPLGDIVASNITPSRFAGIGAYTEAEFRRALREGVRRDGANLYPAMPYTAYRKLTDDDIHALYVYFMREVLPDDRRPPQTHLPFPFSVRASMKLWNALFLGDEKSGPASTPQLARGRYLVDALGHCSACHSPRNWLMAENNLDGYLSGGVVGGWRAPNITSDPASGIGAWSHDELVRYLRTGRVRGKAQAAGPMAEAVEYSLRYLSDSDLDAMATWLKHAPPVASKDRPQVVAAESPLSKSEAVHPGQRLYASACASCHRMGGQGAYDDYFPSLRGNAAVAAARPDNLVMTILEGVSLRDGTTRALMPAFATELSDRQIAQLTNYISLTFGDRRTDITPDDVATLRTGGAKPLIARTPLLLVALACIAALALACIAHRRFVARRRPG